MENECICNFFHSSYQSKFCTCSLFDSAYDEELYEVCELLESFWNFDPDYDEEMCNLCVDVETKMILIQDKENLENDAENICARGGKRRRPDDETENELKVPKTEKFTNVDIKTEFPENYDEECYYKEEDIDNDYHNTDDEIDIQVAIENRIDKEITDCEGDDENLQMDSAIENGIHKILNVDKFSAFVDKIYRGNTISKTLDAGNTSNTEENNSDRNENGMAVNECRPSNVKEKENEEFVINIDNKITPYGVVLRIIVKSDIETSDVEPYFSHVQKYVRNKLATILQRGKTVQVKFKLHGKFEKEKTNFELEDIVRVTSMGNRDARFQAARNTIVREFEALKIKSGGEKTVLCLEVLIQ